MKPKIVAVDGPAGSGKSSICSQICERIGWTYVNTGAIYRALAVLARKTDIALEDERSMSVLSANFARNAVWEPVSKKLVFKGEDLSVAIGTAEVAKDASLIAKQPVLRQCLLPLQRRLGLEAPKGALVDGRDIGTVVFPDADLKIFLTASLEERAKRRFLQLKEPASADDLQRVQDEIARRDLQDSQRDTAPLRQASDAVVIDTSAMDEQQVISHVLQLLQAKGLV